MGLGDVLLWILDTLLHGVICGCICAYIHHIIEHKGDKK